jgi:hypothetical protein
MLFTKIDDQACISLYKHAMDQTAQENQKKSAPLAIVNYDFGKLRGSEF